ncbi:hypothetical protein [Bradyrhizobium sp. NAS80.1]|uniref:hypothetical protein n=1 Tax=Bradyrhizobium sp. NAS80.1 TaxID=1680159 RepID=UPI001160F903|nr:hypothetical protein [Bradyrhizobium sp. NAS80.1]
MKTALLIAATLAFGVVSANAGSNQHHVSSLHQKYRSTVMTAGPPPAGASIDERPAWALYRQNLHDSGYSPKQNMDQVGNMCASCDYHGN